MSRNNSMLDAERFDYDKFERDLIRKYKATGENYSTVSRNVLDRSDTYLASALGKKRLPKRVVIAICKHYNMSPKNYEIPAKQIAVEECPSCADWSGCIRVNSENKAVSVSIYKNGAELVKGRAIIFSGTDRGVVQAISYAAHMCYKLTEQKELGG